MDLFDPDETCEFLPSQANNDTPCYYMQTECKSLPQIENAHPINQSLEGNLTFPARTTIVYLCNIEKHSLQGNKEVSCLYSGEWSDPPVCKAELSLMSPMFFLLCFLLIGITLLLLFGFTLWLRCTLEQNKKRNAPKRNKTFDAIVSCSFDEQHNFVVETLLPHFEEISRPPFLLNYHERDFYLGAKIMDNIQDAIENSNSAIFLICQKFIESKWCREEFERCYEESKKDPDFKLFLIMMEVVDTLENVPRVLERFLKSRTYAKVEDC